MVAVNGDDRGRVPFAVVGLVLLLTSSAFVASTAPERPAATPAVDTAMDRASAESRTAIRRAAVQAGDSAARNPVIVPADTPAGGLLDDGSPFRDSLQVRVYLRARDRLSELSVRQGDVTVTAALPPTPNASALRRATARVDLDRAGENGTALEATVENVTVVARRGNRTVARRTLDPTVVVRTPVLELHESVTTYERRLNRNLTKPGLAQGLTARILQVAWIRGYAQYGSQGLIENVVDNGHVELTTNQALLYEQRAVFGRSDAAGKRALRRASLRVGLSDLFTPWGSYPKQWVSHVLRGGPVRKDDTTTIPRLGGPERVPGPDSQQEVSVGTVADEALGTTLAVGNVSATLRAAYSAKVRLRNETAIVDGHWPSRPPYPEKEGSWTRNSEFVQWQDVEVTGRLDPEATDPRGTWHTLNAYAFRVETKVKRIQQWESGTRTNRTWTTATPTYRVDLRLQGKHAPSPTAPANGIETVHEHGAGPFAGPNLAGVERNATARLLRAHGGPDAVAREVLRSAPGEALPARNVTVYGPQPDGLRAVVMANLTRFRERVKNVSTRVRRDRLATMQANPAGDLVLALERRRDALTGANETYGSVAEKARVAARGAYLDRVIARLNRQRGNHGDARSELDDALGKAEAGSRDLLVRAMENRREPRGIEADGRTDDGTRITAVNGSPPYLTVGQVGHGQVPALPDERPVHPLAAKNVNAFTLPYADLADGLFAALFGSKKGVSLGHAASVLRAVEPVPANESVATHSRKLEAAVGQRVEAIRISLALELADAGVGMDADDRNETIAAGLARYRGTAGRALALANESALEPITRAARRRHGLNETEAALVRALLARTLDDAIADANVPQETVNPLTGPARQWAKAETGAAIETAMKRGKRRGLDRLDEKLRKRLNDDLAEKLGGKTTNRVPAGLPIQPIGTWFTTINVWHVEVKGAYPRFAVSARRGGPDRTDGTLTYVRERAPVRLDYDGDGIQELVGHNERVAFATETSVGVAVPPGPPGVGDMNGNMDERSSGWDEWTGGENGSTPTGWPPATD